MRDEWDADDDASPAKSRLRGIVLALVGIGLLAAAGWWLVQFLATPPGKTRGVAQIALINQPPPPPPKPPEKPPEPPKIKEEVKLDTPKDEPKPDEAKQPDDKPASDKPLALDADATGGSDGFGLAANRGGRELLGTGSGSGAYYTGLLQRQFLEALTRNRKMLRDDFRVVVKVWISDDGRVQKASIVNGSGNAQIDDLIQVTLLEMSPLKDVPPVSMRTIQMRLSTRS